MLFLHTANRVTFNVNVFGTAATPTVRVMVGETPGLSFPAIKLSGDEWETTIDLPENFTEGAHSFKVEVNINGRMFTPINQSIKVGINSVKVVGPSVVVEPAVTEPAAAVKPEPLLVKIAVPAPRIDAEVRPSVLLPETKPANFGKLDALAKNPIQKKPAATVSVKSIRISMADVANEAEKNQPAVSAPIPKPKPKPKTAPPIKETRIPFSMSKGAVIHL